MLQNNSHLKTVKKVAGSENENKKGIRKDKK